MIPEKSYSTACLVSRRPFVRQEYPRFYRCERCGNLSITYGEGKERLSCKCGEVQKKLEALNLDDMDCPYILSYVVFGGMEHNAIRIQVENGTLPLTEKNRIGWIALFTYEGLQMKFLKGTFSSSAIFALAGEDAYSFCNRQICRMGREHCPFQCKRGWRIYAWCAGCGLMQKTL
ncbi:MAG: hypothetical protein HFG54_12340 [Lachnospiraceae bacterium]|jgi:superoxide reductase|nr:hypothetical protein [Lachnospiraceae bacterium]